jgi:hypothetical protein
VTNNWTRTVRVSRKAAKRTHPFGLAVEELDLVPHIPARKKPRLEKPLPTTTDEASRETASPDVSERLDPPTTDNDDANVNADPVTDTQPDAGATGSWTLKEDASLTRAVANTSKKKWGNEYKTDWPAISELILGRTRTQCRKRWKNALDPSIDRANQRTGKWAEDEDIKLKDAVQTHGSKNWGAICALFPGRTRTQCYRRWCDALDPGINRANARTDKWAEDEDIKLKDAVQTHGGKNWGAITVLVPGRTKIQCSNRWHAILDTNIDPTTARASKWTAEEDKKLNDALVTHGGKGWVTISAQVPGRTRKQCCERWRILREKEHGTLLKVPALGQDPHSP